MDEEVVWVAEKIALFDERRQKLLAKVFFTRLGEEELFKWFEWVSGFVYPRNMWIKIEQWMECRFEKNPDWTPRKMATISIKYLRINSKMYPGLLKTAQRVKHRVVMRKRSRKNASIKAQGGNSPGSAGLMGRGEVDEDEQ